MASAARRRIRGSGSVASVVRSATTGGGGGGGIVDFDFDFGAGAGSGTGAGAGAGSRSMRVSSRRRIQPSFRSAGIVGAGAGFGGGALPHAAHNVTMATRPVHPAYRITFSLTVR